MQAAAWIVEVGFPLTLNSVVFLQNLHQLPQAIEMAVALKAHRTEAAIVQFHGSAMLNRAAMMPTRARAEEASRIVQEARARLKGTLVIDYVPADYHSNYPKRCMGGHNGPERHT